MDNLTLKRTDDGSGIPIHPVNPIEDVWEEKVVENLNIEKVFDLYKYACGLSYSFSETFSAFRDKAPILTPEEIFSVHRICSESYLSKTDKPGTTYVGYLFSALIQLSYDNGNNNFRFDTNYFRQFGLNLNGSDDNKLCITLNNDLGSLTFKDSKHLDLHISSSSAYSTCSEIRLSSVHIDEILHKKAQFAAPAVRCEFYTPNEEIAEIIIRRPDLYNSMLDNNNFFVNGKPYDIRK